MKRKIFILLLLFGFLGMLSPVAIHAADEVPIGTTTAPSESFLKSQKQSYAAQNQSALSQSARGGGITPYALGDDWGEPEFPGGGTGGAGETETPSGGMGGPIGDATLPMVLSIFLLYAGFKAVSFKRKANS